MASTANATILLLLAALVCRSVHAGVAYGNCDLWDIQVRQALTGKVVEGKREYRVTISNMCRCPMAEVVVRCFGLAGAAGTVDKTKIQLLGNGLCSVANGAPIVSPVVFTYAEKTPLYFPARHAKPRC